MPTGAARSDMKSAHDQADRYHGGGWEVGTFSALSPVDGAVRGEGARSMGDPTLPRERWLHEDTVDELRDARARIGLARPGRVPSIPRPPLAEMPKRIALYRSLDHSATSAGAYRLFISIAASAVIGLLIGVLAALAIHPNHLPILGL